MSSLSSHSRISSTSCCFGGAFSKRPFVTPPLFSSTSPPVEFHTNQLATRELADQEFVPGIAPAWVGTSKSTERICSSRVTRAWKPRGSEFRRRAQKHTSSHKARSVSFFTYGFLANSLSVRHVNLLGRRALRRSQDIYNSISSVDSCSKHQNICPPLREVHIQPNPTRVSPAIQSCHTSHHTSRYRNAILTDGHARGNPRYPQIHDP